jgi:large subunit ribosomal protein L10Ae
MSVCILADAADIDRAKLIELEYMSVEDLKKLNKNKKLVKVRSSGVSLPGD